MTTRKQINVSALARVEGEGALTLTVEDERVIDAKVRLFEPPRLFEALLRGRHCSEAPDITARICGICPVAYQMSSCHAVESALGVRVDGALRQLRRLLYCGEWIESHVLHMLMLHAPDFLGLADAIEIAQRYPEQVESGLSIKQVGNSLVRAIGGREVHPINVRIGGFYRVPRQHELAELAEPVTQALERAEALLDWLSALDFPEFSRDYELVSMHHPDEYPMNEGRLVSSAGLDISADEWNAHFVEEQVPHSTALQARIRARGAYQVGPLARFVNNFEQLGRRSSAAARRARLDPTCRNPFRMLLVRGVEVIYALEEAQRLIADYQPPTAACVPISMRAASGHAATEAPRGVLYHRYRLDAEGLIEEAQLTPPTAQNQRSIELDLLDLGPALAGLPLPAATRHAELAVRNYDPCISCSTHVVHLRQPGTAE